MKRISKEAKLLKEVLNTTDSEKRLITYNAVAEVIAVELVTMSKLERKRLGRNIIDYINEFVILDTGLMENALKNAIDFKCKTVKYDLREVNSFDEVLGHGLYYSKCTIDSINNNFALYKSALVAATSLKNEIKNRFD